MSDELAEPRVYAGGVPNTAADHCPGLICAACPRAGCICPPCECHPCRKRRRHAATARTVLRPRAKTPPRERRFEPEPTLRR